MKSQENPRTVSVSRHPKVSWAHKSQRTRTFKSQKAFQEPKKVPGFPKVTGHILFGLFGTMSIQNFSGPLKKNFQGATKVPGLWPAKASCFQCLRCPSPKNPRGHKVPRSPQKCQGSNKSKKTKMNQRL